MEKEKIAPCSPDLTPLISLIAALRSENGCPWDKKQTAKSMAVYLLEETYELTEAINTEDPDAVREELGDVLFHILFIAHLFQEQKKFDMNDVISLIHRKMVRRHPHVFGESTVETAEDVKRQWNEIKKKEKPDLQPGALLDTVPAALPGLMRAYRISERAAANGFDWDTMAGVMEKAQEEWVEFKTELEKGTGDEKNRNAVSMEFGDLLFTLVNVARFARIHPERALAEAILKFKQRFAFMEKVIREDGKIMSNVSPEEKDVLWNIAKVSTHNPPVET